MADTPAQITYGHRGSYRDGEDAPLPARLQKAPASPGAQGTAFVPADVTSITWTLYRIYKGETSIVVGYNAITLVVADVLLGALTGWQNDAVGYNFRHVIDEAIVSPEATYRSFYDFLLVSGESFTIEQKFDYLGFDEGETPPDPGSGGGGSTPTPTTLIFSQTQTVTVANNAAATTLIGSGQGSNLIAANAPAVGDKYYFEAAGYYGTKTLGPVSAVMTFNVGAELTLTFPTIELLPGRANARWKMRGTLKYRTIGAAALVVADASLEVDYALPLPAMVGTVAEVTLPSDASKIPNLKIDWSTADAANSWSCQDYDIRKAGIAA